MTNVVALKMLVKIRLCVPLKVAALRNVASQRLNSYGHVCEYC